MRTTTVRSCFSSLGWALLLGVALLLGGCSNLNGTRLEPVLGGDLNLVRLGDTIAETLVRESFPPLFPRQEDQPLLVTTLVDNQHLDKTSDFGRNLQNTITSGLVKRGFTVKELKLRPDLLVQSDQGEFMLSRRLDEIAASQRAQAVVAGTYTMSNRVMYLSVRLVSPQRRTIRSSYEDRLTLDENTLAMVGLQYAHSEEELVPQPQESLLDRIFY
ncbi:FlgO family outer membrane protein [Desulfogranum mediterraneum]|uniref:FlgO family outer membrane protein n=1 Tax=Desulfogranum mediterraneum TaxID=160661 RepID=UPI0012947655|nr:FlgO family outer membrane protein [Desulfogranum mediterraneum]